jgi:hypothetical protein
VEPDPPSDTALMRTEGQPWNPLGLQRLKDKPDEDQLRQENPCPEWRQCSGSCLSATNLDLLQLATYQPFEVQWQTKRETR